MNFGAHVSQEAELSILDTYFAYNKKYIILNNYETLPVIFF